MSTIEGEDPKTTWIHLRVSQAALRSAKKCVPPQERVLLDIAERNVTNLLKRMVDKYPEAKEMSEDTALRFSDVDARIGKKFPRG